MRIQNKSVIERVKAMPYPDLADINQTIGVRQGAYCPNPIKKLCKYWNLARGPKLAVIFMLHRASSACLRKTAGKNKRLAKSDIHG